MRLIYLAAGLALAGCGGGGSTIEPGRTLSFDASAPLDAYVEPDSDSADASDAADDAPEDTSSDPLAAESSPSCANGVRDGDESDIDCGGSCLPCDLGASCQSSHDCSSSRCVSGQCAAAECGDGAKDGDETDVDCGGTCMPCADGAHCSKPADCAGQLCRFGVCVSPECADGVTNGAETATDCGGGTCAPCPAGTPCVVPDDCGSAVCAAGVCAWPSCDDGVLNGSEASVDCGGSCPGCPTAAECQTAADCISAVCHAGHCAAPTCSDGVTNGSETGPDCGGTCPSACAVGLGCHTGDDCDSGVCLAGATCAPATCVDGQLNGAETDVDCGGPCGPCPVGGGCDSPADCADGQCSAHVCLAPSCSDGARNGSETGVDCGGSCAHPCALADGCAWDGDCQSHDCYSGVCAIPYDLFAARSYVVGAIGSIIAADLDGDQRPELAVAHDQVRVLANNGDGTFAPYQEYPLPDAIDVVAADIDRDGAVDLVGVDQADVLVYQNDGTGHLHSAATIPATKVKDLIAADVDGDGFADIVTAHDLGFDVYLNDGTFGMSAPIRQTDSASTAVLAADFDHDGKNELAVSQASALKVFHNEGGSSFSVDGTYPLLGGGRTLVLGDFTHDGWPDLFYPDDRMVWANDRLGHLTMGEAFPTTTTSVFAVADPNADSWPDLYAVKEYREFELWQNDRGVLDTAETFSLCNSYWTAVAADLNGDCRSDLAVTSTGTVAVALVRADGRFTRFHQVGLAASRSAVADLNGDGWPDIVSAVSPSSGLDELWLSTSQAGTAYLPSVIEYQAGQIGQVSLQDVNGDQRLDLLALYPFVHKVAVRMQKADGTFGSQVTYPTAWRPIDVSVADLDNDGDPDLAVACQGEGLIWGGITVLRGIGNGALEVVDDLEDLAHPASVELADLNHDGRLDIVASDNGIGGIAYHLGSGNCAFQKAKTVFSGLGVQDLALGDFDGDSEVDGAVSLPLADAVAVARHMISSPAVETHLVQKQPERLVRADLNRDGREDLVVGNSNSSSVSLLLNTGADFASAMSYAVPTSDLRDGVVADMDRDGWLDVVIGGQPLIAYGRAIEPFDPCPVCGDGIRDAREPCDDGNPTPGDGCDSRCQVEPGHACSGVPSACVPTCGDGLIVTGKEECDDANDDDDDGCDSCCQVEAGWACSGVTSACRPVCGDALAVGDEWCDDANLDDDDGCPSTCQRVVWGRSIGEASYDQSCVARVNAAGQPVLACTFEGTVQVGANIFTSAGGTDVMLATLARDGTVQQAKQLTSSGAQAVQWLQVDAAGNRLISGPFSGSIEFDGKTLPAPTPYSYYMAKLSPTGVHLWSRAFANTKQWFPLEMALDPDGNAILAGSYDGGALDLGTGPLPVVAYEEAFLVKVGPDGSVLWTNVVTGSGIQRYFSVGADAGGDLVTWGTNSGHGVPIGSGIEIDEGSFLIRRTPDGTPLWANEICVLGCTAMHPLAAAVAPSGRTTVFGRMDNPVDFGGGSLPAGADCTYFLAIFDTNGQHFASRSFPGTELPCSIYVGAVMTADTAGNSYVALTSVESGGTGELSLAAFDDTAHLVWHSPYRAATTSLLPSSIAVAGPRLIAAGTLSGSIDFHTLAIGSAGKADGFVASFVK